MILRFIFMLIYSSLLFAEIKIGDDAPTFFLRTLDNKKFYLSDELKNKKPIVFDFFATWCEPCIKKMPVIDSLSHIYKDVNFYYVNVSGITQEKEKRKEDSKVVRKLIERLKINSKSVLMDKYGLTAEKYDALILPQLVIINSKGKIEYIHPRDSLNVGKEISKVLNKLTDVKETK